jgi:hypothetical protein
MKKFIFLFMVIFLVSCGANSSVIEKVSYRIELGKDLSPTGELVEVRTKYDINNLPSQLPFPVYSMLGGNGLNKFLEYCDGLGRIENGEIYLFSKNQSCFIVQVPLEELNSPYGANLNISRPVLELSEDFLAGKRIILVNASFSPEMQGLLLAEFFSHRSDSFYYALPGIVRAMSEMELKSGRLWMPRTLQEGFNHYSFLSASGKERVDDWNLIELGGIYGSVFGNTPRSEAEAFHRGRFLEFYTLSELCKDKLLCDFDEKILDLKDF